MVRTGDPIWAPNSHWRTGGPIWAPNSHRECCGTHAGRTGDPIRAPSSHWRTGDPIWAPNSHWECCGTQAGRTGDPIRAPSSHRDQRTRTATGRSGRLKRRWRRQLRRAQQAAVRERGGTGGWLSTACTCTCTCTTMTQPVHTADDAIGTSAARYTHGRGMRRRCDMMYEALILGPPDTLACDASALGKSYTQEPALIRSRRSLRWTLVPVLGHGLLRCRVGRG